MKKGKYRYRFIVTPDQSKEAEIDKTLEIFRSIVKYLESIIPFIVCKIENTDPRLIMGNLSRFQVGVESCILLLSHGYTGTAKAMLRQLYEFLVWAKLGLSADEQTLTILKEQFFNQDLDKSYSVTRILQKTTIIVPAGEQYVEDCLKTYCQRWYRSTSYLTHATSFAQQSHFPSEDFYTDMEAILAELRELIWSCLILYHQYSLLIYDKSNCLERYKNENPEYEFSEDEKWLIDVRYYIAYNSKIYDYLYKISNEYTLEETKLIKTFKYDWKINMKR